MGMHALRVWSLDYSTSIQDWERYTAFLWVTQAPWERGGQWSVLAAHVCPTVVARPSLPSYLRPLTLPGWGRPHAGQWPAVQ